MSSINEKIQLTSRELEIMSALWGSDKPLIASDVAKMNSISLNTVHAVIKKLLNKGLIEVADIVYSGTVLSRSYRPVISASEYAAMQFTEQMQYSSRKLAIPKIVAALLEREEKEAEMIAELEALLEERKKALK